jgi:hypothetical protein
MTTAVSTLTKWLEPSEFNKQTVHLLKSPEISDVVEGVIVGLQWFNTATGSEKAHHAAEKFEVLEEACALPAIPEKIGAVKTHLEEGENLKAFQSGLLLGTKVAKSAKFFNSIDVFPLGEHLKTANAAFWGFLGVFDSINIVGSVKEAHELNKSYNSAKEADKSIIGHRFWIACLNVVKAVNCVAQACIALVAIFFASIATGIIFNPLVFLGLTTSWLTLNFGIHYYEKFVDKWEKEAKDAPKALPQQPIRA